MNSSPRSFRTTVRRHGWRVVLMALCKLMILFTVFQMPAEVSSRPSGETETTELCREFDLRNSRFSVRQVVLARAEQYALTAECPIKLANLAAGSGLDVDYRDHLLDWTERAAAVARRAHAS
jgi:hypothetical protein